MNRELSYGRKAYACGTGFASRCCIRVVHASFMRLGKLLERRLFYEEIDGNLQGFPKGTPKHKEHGAVRADGCAGGGVGHGGIH